MRNISIIGAGAQGVAIAAQAARCGFCVRLLTRQKDLGKNLKITDDILQKQFEVSLADVSNDPQRIIASSDLVLSTVPGFALENVFRQIRPFLRPNVPLGGVVGSNGFAFLSTHIFKENPLFAFARTPYTARMIAKNHVRILGHKKNQKSPTIAIYNLPNPADFADFWAKILEKPTTLLPNFWDIALSNSNPLLHTSRLFTLFSKNQRYSAPPYFYKEWDDASSQLLLAMDSELQELLNKIPTISKNAIVPLPNYYEVATPQALTAKIQSIESFQNILAPVKEKNGVFVADTAHRYFVEDFAFGLGIVVQLLKKANPPPPRNFASLGMGKKYSHNCHCAIAIFVAMRCRIAIVLIIFKNPRSIWNFFEKNRR